jgi:hypothetical protein
MTLKILAAAAGALCAVVLGAAPASADPIVSGCDVHLDTVVGGICVPTHVGQ